MIKQLQRRHRVVQRRCGSPGLGPAFPPGLTDQPHRFFAAQGRAQAVLLGELEHLAQHGPEAVLGLPRGGEQHIHEFTQRPEEGLRLPARGAPGRLGPPQRHGDNGGDILRQLPPHRLAPGRDQRDDPEAVAGHPADELIGPDADPAELVRVGAFPDECHIHLSSRHPLHPVALMIAVPSGPAGIVAGFTRALMVRVEWVSGEWVAAGAAVAGPAG